MAMLFYIEPNTTPLEGYYQQDLMKPHIEATCPDNTNQMLHYIINNPPPQSSTFFDSNSYNKLMFSDTTGDPFGGRIQEGLFSGEMGDAGDKTEENTTFQRVENVDKRGKNKRKRAMSKKTSEQVESQRMTHIAVERNRRKQMNEHLNILRSIMPHSYVQRGDQASIIGGAIEFVRELEQLLECLESEKRRRLYGGNRASPTVDFPNDRMRIEGCENETRDETAESNSWLANVQVKVVGCDGLIKILSRRKNGLLSRTIAAIEDLQLKIVHTSVTTIEQSVMSSFNFKMRGEARLTAEDIADSIQQILSSIYANSSIIS